MLPGATQFSSPTLFPRLSQDAVATSPHLQQFSAVRQLIRDLQQRTPRTPKRPHLPPVEAGWPSRRMVQTSVYKQKLNQYNNALKVYEQYINQLLSEQAFEINKNIENEDAIVSKSQTPSKVTQLKSSAYNTPQFLPLRIQIPPNYFHI